MTQKTKSLLLLFGCCTAFLGWLNAESQTAVHDDFIVKSLDSSGADYRKFVILLHEAYDGTNNVGANYAVGRIFTSRGSAGAWNIKRSVQVSTGSAYQSNRGSLVSTDSDGKEWTLVTVYYGGKKYMAVEPPYQASVMPRIRFEGFHRSTAEGLKVVSYFDTYNNSVLNQEVYGSIAAFDSNMTQVVDAKETRFKNDVEVRGDLSVLGAFDTGSLFVANNLVADGDLSVTGSLSATSFDDIKVNGLSRFYGEGATMPRFHFTNSSSGAIWQIGTLGGTDADAFSIGGYSGTSGNITITKEGNVGIGTTDPQASLHINPAVSGNNTLRISTNSATDGTEARLDLHTTSNQSGSWGARIAAQRKGTNARTDLKFYTTNAAGQLLERARVDENGSIGVGTSAPQARLEVNGQFRVTGLGPIPTSGQGIEMYWSSSGLGDIFAYDRDQNAMQPLRIRGSKILFESGNVGLGVSAPSVPLHVQSNSGGNSVSLVGRYGDHNSNIGFFNHDQSKRSLIQGDGESIRLMSAPSVTELGVTQGKVTVFQDLEVEGMASIGVWNYDNLVDQAKLSVGGKIRAEEIVVKLQGQWADYVFENGYELRPLDEVQAHIAAHGHLPGIPSAAQIENEGLSMAKTQILMMEKIEELTLYAIEKDREVSELKERMAKLEAMLLSN